MTLVRLVYVSTAIEAFTHESLDRLVRAAAERNRELEITGALLFGGGNFMQVLEGEEKDVETIFASIRRDPRHTWVETVQRDHVDRRLFSDWSMTLCNFDESVGVDRRDFEVIRRFLEQCAVDHDATTHGLVNYFASRRGELVA